MPSYVITGANRGLGYAFVQTAAKDPQNTIIGLVRNKVEADKKLAADGYKNVTFLQADITDRPALLAAREEAKKITGGRLDYLINNAALVQSDEGKTLKDYADEGDALEEKLLRTIRTNTVGLINAINAFLPLLQSGSKVLLISTGMADPDLVNYGGIADAPVYAISKAAANMVIYKYNATFKSQGILFFAVSPGVVATWEDGNEPPAIENLRATAPNWTGPLTPTESATKVLGLLHDFSLEKGNGGAFVSHYGNKQWM
ncbi:hypothetical protein B0A52_04982 [Exophiala mesophila]|uniref:NAD(P)-binding protein n=1 Tax=Exophiala mesophila TaxID=212818 RepID=A0A438N6Q6_EXOME|nr:hypothetical protein B0A52_04982 [Exophiala mesophila]